MSDSWTTLRKPVYAIILKAAAHCCVCQPSKGKSSSVETLKERKKRKYELHNSPLILHISDDNCAMLNWSNVYRIDSCWMVWFGIEILSLARNTLVPEKEWLHKSHHFGQGAICVTLYEIINFVPNGLSILNLFYLCPWSHFIHKHLKQLGYLMFSALKI